MSFTSQVVRVGEGWDSGQPAEETSSRVYSVHNDASTALGPEGSSDDSKELFPDTFVDMAKAANEEIEEQEDENRGTFFRLKRKKKKSKR